MIWAIATLDDGTTQLCSYKPMSALSRFLKRMSDPDKPAAVVHAGERWITVHPHGKEDSKGVPVLIREVAGEKGTYHVIGGAGGTLRYMRLTNVKSPEEYKQKGKERQAARKAERAEAAKAEIEKIKATGKSDEEVSKVLAERSQKVEAVKVAEKEAQKAAIAAVAAAVGWSPESLKFKPPKADMKPDELVRAEEAHHANLVRKATAAHRQIQERIIRDHEAREHAEIGELPMSSEDPDKLSLADVTPDAPEAGRGYSAKQKERLMAADPRVAAVAEMDADALKKKLAELEAPIRESEKVGDEFTPEAEKRGTERVSAANAELEQSLQDGGLDKARDLVRELVVKHEIAQPERDELRERKRAEMTPAQRAAAEARIEANKERHAKRRRDIANGLYEQLELPTKPIDTKLLGDALKAWKRMKLASKATAAVRQDIEAGAGDDIDIARVGNAYQVEFDDDAKLEDAVRKDIADGISSMRARAFLSSVEERMRDVASEAGMKLGVDWHQDARKYLERHIGAGAFGALDEASQAFTGSPVLSREVSDVLGAAGAAQLIAWHAHNNAPKDVDAFREAVSKYHADRADDIASTATADAAEHVDAAKAIELGSAGTSSEFRIATEMNARRREHLDEARKILGVALGELEASAALEYALGQKPVKDITVSFGPTSTEETIRQVRALGLAREDYELDTDGRNSFVKFNESAFPKLAAPPDPELRARGDVMHEIEAGARDEDGWLPAGFAKRPKASFDEPSVTTPLISHAEKLNVHPGMSAEDLGTAVRTYIGSRIADGMSPAEILRELHSAEARRTLQTAGLSDQYGAVMREIAPARRDTGKKNEDGHPIYAPVLAEEHEAAFRKHGDDYLRAKHGDDGAKLSLHGQSIDPTDPDVVEAAHRALADHPVAIAAFKPLGDVTLRERRSMAKWVEAEHTSVIDPATAEKISKLKAKLEETSGKGPPEFIQGQGGLFGGGDKVRNPAYLKWKSDNADAVQEIADLEKSGKGLKWEDYVEHHGSTSSAYEAVQDLIRGKFATAFADAHKRITKKALRVGDVSVRNGLKHADAIDPVAAAKRAKIRREMAGRVQARNHGRYAEDDVKAKINATAAADRAAKEQQFSLLGEDDVSHETDDATTRKSLGDTVEAQIGRVMSTLSATYDPDRGHAVIREPSMSGKLVHQQRAVKQIEAVRNIGLFHGPGSGKTNSMIGGLTHLIAKGKVKKGVFAVPSGVLGQMGSEARTFLEPGKYKWLADPSASYEDRKAAYADPGTHFVVVTHQGLRDDVARMVGEHMGVTHDVASDRLRGMTDEQRDAAIGAALKHHGAEGMTDYIAVDEGHEALNRQGKEDSSLAQTVDSLARLAVARKKYTVFATGTEIKNDTSEVFDWLRKLDPARFKSRDEFMRKYGANTTASARALKRLTDAYFTHKDFKVEGLQVNRHVHTVPLSDTQRGALDDTYKAYDEVRSAKEKGTINVDAARRLSPGAFAGRPEDEHEEIAQSIHNASGIVKESALRRAVDGHVHDPEKGHTNAKISKVLDIVNEAQKGTDRKPVVVFAHSLEAVDALHKAITAAGHKAITVKGSEDDAKSKFAKIQAFSPKKGTPTADVLIASDALSAGANLQRGRVLINYDTPNTFKTWEQRQARINRIGQKAREIDLHDVVGDAEHERRARSLLDRKRGLHEIFHGDHELVDDSGLAKYYAVAKAQRAESRPLAEVA